MKNKWLRRIDDVFPPARVTQSSQNEECDLCRAVPCRGNFSIGIRTPKTSECRCKQLAYSRTQRVESSRTGSQYPYASLNVVGKFT